MNAEALDKEIYRRFIVPTQRKRSHFVGVEFEIPLVNLKKQAVDFDVIHRMVPVFAETFDFTDFTYDEEGQISSALSPKTGDDLSFDCSYNTLEFSFGRADDLNEIEKRFHTYYRFLYDYLAKEHHTLTGMGINPYYRFNHIVPIPNGRYRMLLHHLNSYAEHPGHMIFHDIPYYGLIACSSQTHLDVEEQELPRVINAFNRLEPLKALLFANSPFDGGYLCVRDHLWRESMHGWNPHNVDTWDVDLESVEEIIAYIRSMSLYCTERDGKYINFLPTPLEQYFSAEQITGEYYTKDGYQQISVTPREEDLDYLRSFKFVDLTFRGTVELRSACMQPIAEAMTVPAFNAGLKEELPELERILAAAPVYQKGYSASELRRLFVMRDLPLFADPEELKQLCTDLTDLAESGLKKRGKGEEHMLEPLKRRAQTLTSPALEMLTGIEKGKTQE